MGWFSSLLGLDGSWVNLVVLAMLLAFVIAIVVIFCTKRVSWGPGKVWESWRLRR